MKTVRPSDGGGEPPARLSVELSPSELCRWERDGEISSRTDWKEGEEEGRERKESRLGDWLAAGGNG